MRGLPSQVKGDRFRAYSRRSSWVRIPSPAFSKKVPSNTTPPGFFPFNTCPKRLFFQCDDSTECDQPDVYNESERPDNRAAQTASLPQTKPIQRHKRCCEKRYKWQRQRKKPRRSP